MLQSSSVTLNTTGGLSGGATVDTGVNITLGDATNGRILGSHSEKEEFADQTGDRWNQIAAWLRRLREFRAAS